MHKKVIGIVGSRRRCSKEDFEVVEKKFLELYNEGDSICSGGCARGADNFAEIIASKHKVPIKVHPARWDIYGKTAGFKRNTKIAEDSDILIACRSIDLTGGTEDTVKKFKRIKPNNLIVSC